MSEGNPIELVRGWRLADLAGPLEEKLREIERETEELEMQLVEKREDRRRLRVAVAQLHGTAAKPGVKRRSTKTHARGATKVERWLDPIRARIAEMNGAEIIAAELYREIRADADRRGLKLSERPSPASVLRVIEHLHELGELRLTRKARGGASVYVATAGSNDVEQ